MYEDLGPKGLEILAFPCNQFGKQEPGTDEEILEFATTKYGATFQLFSKVNVNGDEAHPIYKWLKNEKGSLLGKGLKWNFCKFVLDKKGNVVDRYLPAKDLKPIVKQVEGLLEEDDE